MTRTSSAESRAFYETAYRTDPWGRVEDREAHLPRRRFTKMWYRAFLSHLVPLMNFASKRVLEVGCGNGFLAPHLCGLGAEFVGIDIALSALNQVPRSQGARCNVALADATSLPFPNGSFDILICMEVLEHVSDPNVLLSECFRVIRPLGQVVFSCPNYFNLHIFPKLLANLGGPFFRRYMRHQVIDRTLTAFGARRLVARHGTVILQRGVRLHPPMFEQLDYRLSPTNPLIRINDFLFHLERSCGDVPPFNYMGLHTILLLKPKRFGAIQ